LDEVSDVAGPVEPPSPCWRPPNSATADKLDQLDGVSRLRRCKLDVSKLWMMTGAFLRLRPARSSALTTGPSGDHPIEAK
jgi:hypothetical protein